MKVARSVSEILSQHTTLALECVDRLYLNVYVPVLQRAAGAAYFFRKMRGAAVPSSVLMAPMTQRFVNAINRYAETQRHRRRVVPSGRAQGRPYAGVPAQLVRGRGRDGVGPVPRTG